MKIISLSFFLKIFRLCFFFPICFFKKNPFIPQSVVFPLAMCSRYIENISTAYGTHPSQAEFSGAVGGLRQQGGLSVPPCAQVPRAVEGGRGRRSSTSPRRHLGGSGLGLALLSLLGGRRGRRRQSGLLKGRGIRGWGH